MITLEVGNIPTFLRDGSFYQALDTEEEDQSSMEIPESCYAPNDEVTNFSEFAKMINVVAFWGLNTIPQSLLQFCDCTEPVVWSDVLVEKPDLYFARALQLIFHPVASLEKAIELGINEAVAYLAQMYIGGTGPAATAASLGRLDYLAILHKHEHPWDETACVKAAENGHLFCLQYLHENGCPWDHKLYITGLLDCVKYAFEEGLKWQESIADHVAASGQLDKLKYFVENGCYIDASTTHAAANTGHADCLNYLLEMNCDVEYCSCEGAAYRGHLECLKVIYVYTGTTWWDTTTTLCAAKGGQLECLKYLLANGCPWNASTPCYAAGYAQLNCLQFAVQNNCPIPPSILVWAVQTVSPDSLLCLQYLHSDCLENGPEFEDALIWGNYYVLQYLIDQKCPYNPVGLNQNGSQYLMAEFTSWKDIYKSIHEYDNNLLNCIDCLVANKWDWVMYGQNLLNYISKHTDQLLLSTQRVKELQLVKGIQL